MGIGFHVHAQAPYDLPKFQAAIAECKLQAPDSSTRATQSQLIAGFSNSEFYVADTDKMAFYQTGDSMRTELRYLNNWYIGGGDRVARANMKIITQTCDQVTVMQIHDDANAGSGPNKPLLRIYKHLTKSPVNHLWAAIKEDSGGINTEHVDLGPAPTGYFDCEISLVGGNMSIAVDGVTLAARDVSFWTYPSYWKAGVYLQDPGEATVYFDQLSWLPNQAPTCSITSPDNGADYPAGDDVVINADASDSDGIISKVEFFEGANLLAADTTAPYSYTWSNVPQGSYSLTAKATDDKGAVTTSSAVSITLASATGGPVTNSVINDSFADGNRANTGTLQADWWSSSSTSGNSIEAYTGQLGLVSGTSGRGIHGTFSPQTMAIDETLTATLTFTTPATVGTGKGSAFKIAIMELNDPALAADLSSSSSSINPIYTNLPGYLMDLDVNTGSSADVSLRKHITPNSSGRFLGTTTEWTSMGSSPDAGYSFVPSTEYVVVFTVTKTGADSLDLTGSLSQGGAVLDSHTQSDTSGTVNNFGMLGIWANSSTFGSTTTLGSTADNGITFSNIKIERVTPTTVASTPPVLSSGTDGDNFQIGFLAENGASYQVIYTTNLQDATWIPIESIVGDGSTNWVSYPATHPAAFYRVTSP